MCLCLMFRNLKSMKKQIINEINRQREMMGLSLLAEQSFDSITKFTNFITNHDSNVLTVLENMFGGTSRGQVSSVPPRNVKTFLKTIQNQLGRGLKKGLEFARTQKTKVDINIVAGGDAVVSTEVVKNLKATGRPKSLDLICKYINGYNLKNFGNSQITGFNTQTGRQGVNTVDVEKTSKLDGVYVFSADYTDIEYNETPGQGAIAGTDDVYVDIAGEEIVIPVSYTHLTLPTIYSV